MRILLLTGLFVILFIHVFSQSVEELKKYKENAEQLNKNLESLNTIYSNMLGAMSYKK